VVTSNPDQLTLEAVTRLVNACHNASFAAGWWTRSDGSSIKTNPYCFSTKLMLIVSELAEAMEGDRKNKMDDHLPHRESREVELADALIRICDLAGAYNLDLAGAVVEKMAYNAQRADHKPEARAAEGGKAY
jgi:NTP pyrophosphatase (non-canonical NTP hydrolase)